SSTFFGIPLILIASQLLLGRPRLWLPRLLRERSLDQATFARLTTRVDGAGAAAFRAAREAALLAAAPGDGRALRRPGGPGDGPRAGVPDSLRQLDAGRGGHSRVAGLERAGRPLAGIGTLVAAGSLALAAGIVGAIGYAANGFF